MKDLAELSTDAMRNVFYGTKTAFTGKEVICSPPDLIATEEKQPI